MEIYHSKGLSRLWTAVTGFWFVRFPNLLLRTILVLIILFEDQDRITNEMLSWIVFVMITGLIATIWLYNHSSGIEGSQMSRILASKKEKQIMIKIMMTKYQSNYLHDMFLWIFLEIH